MDQEIKNNCFNCHYGVIDQIGKQRLFRGCDNEKECYGYDLWEPIEKEIEKSCLNCKNNWGTSCPVCSIYSCVGFDKWKSIEENQKLKTRPAATPEPMSSGNGKVVITEVIKDLLARDEVGQIKYKTSLKTDNGRDALMDAFQEACDLVMYLKQAIMERNNEK